MSFFLHNSYNHLVLIFRAKNGSWTNHNDVFRYFKLLCFLIYHLIYFSLIFIRFFSNIFYNLEKFSKRNFLSSFYWSEVNYTHIFAWHDIHVRIFQKSLWLWRSYFSTSALKIWNKKKKDRHKKMNDQPNTHQDYRQNFYSKEQKLNSLFVKHKSKKKKKPFLVNLTKWY